MQSQSQVQGKVKLDHYSVNQDSSKEIFKISHVVWYSGNQSIQEVPHINIRTDSTGSETNIYIEYYLFIDSNSHQYFYYRNFSDTARLVKHFKKTAPFEKYGGWDLYFVKKFDYDESKKITDTIIDGINYERYRYRKVNNGKTIDFILYASCEIKDLPVQYFKPFRKEISCPIVRQDTYFEGRLTGINRFQSISDTLTNEEEKVFQSWRKKIKPYHKAKIIKGR
jgi:hypothetical protein